MKLTLESKYNVGDRVQIDIWYDRHKENGVITKVYIMNEQVYYCVKLDADNSVIRLTSKNLWSLE